MYRKEFVHHLAVNANITELEADVLTSKFFITLTETLLERQSICFPDFGVFELHATAQQSGWDGTPEPWKSTLFRLG